MANPLHIITAWSLFPPSCFSPPTTTHYNGPCTHAHIHTDVSTQWETGLQKGFRGNWVSWLLFVALSDWICIQDSFPKKKNIPCLGEPKALWFENASMCPLSWKESLGSSGSLMVSSFQLFHQTITYWTPVTCAAQH
jgi:hypothetical protein